MLKRKIKSKGQQNTVPNEGFARFWELFERYGSILFIVLLVGTYTMVRITAPSDTQHAQLRFVENGSATIFDSEAGSQISLREPLSGTEYETALRLREAGALGLAVSLSVFAEHAVAGKAPADHRDVIRNMIARKLTPPGIETENGSIKSHQSELRFSYRKEPISFEILALPKDQAAGSALLLRFPLLAGETNSLMYFESSTPVQIPVPFSTNERLTAAGWKIRNWRSDALPLNESMVRELREHDDWLKSRNQGR